MNIAIHKAREFAKEAHGRQKYGEHPYVKHLDDVAGVLTEFGFGDDLVLMQAAYLHDVLEDTAISKALLEERFGIDVAALVGRVTNRGWGRRDAKNALTWPRIRGRARAVILKLADRIANVRACVSTGHNKLEMYRGEYPAFRTALHTGDPAAEKMWAELDRLFEVAR